MDLSAGHGVLCVCESEAFAGDSVMNAPTTCVEKTCDNVNCGVGASCYPRSDGGYVCRCDDAYHADEAANGARLECVERTCENVGFSNPNNCGDHAMCSDLGPGKGV
ncbi:MAG: hypothetical protein VXW72_03995, partial [Candidatus Thermoplasmatota archaeon]|nr:hypothetical protein [Candidatus Thermoplasmatota archaeon]